MQVSHLRTPYGSVHTFNNIEDRFCGGQMTIKLLSIVDDVLVLNANASSLRFPFHSRRMFKRQAIHRYKLKI